MVIKFNFEALEQTRWHEYLVRFMLGGLVTALTGWLGERFGPVIGGLFLAFPAIFPASATLVEKHEQDKKRRAGIAFTVRGRLAAALDARGAVMGAIGGMAFACVALESLPRSALWLSLLMSLATWSVVSSGLWYVRKHHPWARPTQRHHETDDG